MSYETDRWAYLSPAFREAHNRHRAAKGLPPIPPPERDLYVPPKPSGIKFAADASEVLREMRAEGALLRERFIAGAEDFLIAGRRVGGIEVIEVPGGFEGIAEGKKGVVYDNGEGFQVRR